MTAFGYTSCSTGTKAAAEQVAELRAAGCADVYCELTSATERRRPGLATAMRELSPGDVLVVSSLHNLARSNADLLRILSTLSEQNIGFMSVRDSWANTTTPQGLMMLTALRGLVQFERELISARIARAKARGARLGRRRKLNARQRKHALARLAAGESQGAVARTYNVDPSTIGYLFRGNVNSASAQESCSPND